MISNTVFKTPFITDQYDYSPGDVIESAHETSSKRCPEEMLALAILEATLLDLRYPRKSKYYKDAIAWLYDASDTSYIFSFENICYLFHLSPTWIRSRVFAGDYKTILRNYRLAGQSGNRRVLTGTRCFYPHRRDR